MPKKILIIGALFLTVLLINIISADDWCIVAANSADCETTLSGKVVMSISGSTNAHGSLAGQGVFAPVLCCNFGEGDTTCGADNKVLSLSSSTNAHAEAPNLGSPNYNNDVCYDSLKECRITEDSCSVAMNEIAVAYISSGETQSYTNAHIEEAGLGSQNYDSKICCVVEYPKICDLTSAEWGDSDGEVFAGADVNAIVNGTDCGGKEISFEVFRGSTSCDDIDGCENPANAVFGAGSNSVSGVWNASPIHDNEYSFVATVVANPDESISSSAPDLLVTEPPPGYCSSIAICSQYDEESACNSNICNIDVQDSVPGSVDCDASGITCECIWEDNECKGSWGGGDGGYCGDGTIDSGEQCEVGDWGDITNCTNFDSFTGGTLSCDDCQFNTSLCTGGVDGGYCGDDVINPGETCDGSASWSPITGCSDFDDFTDGTLTCTDCQFDTSDCVGPGGAGVEVGTCVYTQYTEDNCDDGFLTFTWTATWVWDDSCPEGSECRTENAGLAAECADGQKTVECPAQIPLPFFNIYSFIVTLILIALIYAVIILSKKKKLGFK